MKLKQFLTLEALVVISTVLCLELFSNNQLMKRISSSNETMSTIEQMKEETEVTVEEKTEEEIVVSKDSAVNNTFSSFPRVTSLEEVMSKINPLKGETYIQRQNNYEGIDIFVHEEVVISSESECFPKKIADIYIYDDKSIISILNEEKEEEETQILMPYNLYRKNEEIILEGIDLDTRKYYEYHLQNGYICGGKNVDVPDEEKEFIILTFDNGTYTLKGNKLTFWNFLREEATGEIPEPAEPQNVIICKYTYGYTVDSKGYYGIPYIDKNGNIINLIITTESKDWNECNPNTQITGIDYTIVASNVKRIIDPRGRYLHACIVYQNEDGDYQLAVINTGGKLKETIDLNEKTVSKIQFNRWVSGSSKGYWWITYLEVEYEVKGYGKVKHLFYDLKNEILMGDNTKHLEDLLEGEFSISEFEERYPKVIQEIKKFE